MPNVLNDEPNDEIEVDFSQNMNLLQSLLLKVLIWCLEFTDLIDAIVVNQLSEILRNLHFFTPHKLLY